MDSNSWVEQIQFQLNLKEFFYRKRIGNRFYKFLDNKTLEKLLSRLDFLINHLSIYQSPFLRLQAIKSGFLLPSFLNIRPWFIFWLKNSLDLLGKNTSFNFPKKTFFSKWKSFGKNKKNSGFILGQKSLLTLYSETLSGLFRRNQLTLEDKQDIRSNYYILRRLKISRKNFRTSILGEHDPRAFYCVFVTASLYNILTPELSSNIIAIFKEYLNHDGGGALNKKRESHGAITFCFLATTLFFSKKSLLKDIRYQTKDWALEKQTLWDYGYHGRLSKLSDSCYFFWIGAISIILCLPFCKDPPKFLFSFKDKFSSGLVDKIGKPPDLYHNCYYLSGLSLLTLTNRSYNFPIEKVNQPKKHEESFGFFSKFNPVFGVKEDKLLHNFYFFYSFDSKLKKKFPRKANPVFSR